MSMENKLGDVIPEDLKAKMIERVNRSNGFDAAGEQEFRSVGPVAARSEKEKKVLKEKFESLSETVFTGIFDLVFVHGEFKKAYTGEDARKMQKLEYDKEKLKKKFLEQKASSKEDEMKWKQEDMEAELLLIKTSPLNLLHGFLQSLSSI